MFVVMKSFEGDSWPIFASPHKSLAKVRAEGDAREEGIPDSMVNWSKGDAMYADPFRYEIVFVESDLGGTVA